MIYYRNKHCVKFTTQLLTSDNCQNRTTTLISSFENNKHNRHQSTTKSNFVITLTSLTLLFHFHKSWCCRQEERIEGSLLQPGPGALAMGLNQMEPCPLSEQIWPTGRPFSLQTCGVQQLKHLQYLGQHQISPRLLGKTKQTSFKKEKSHSKCTKL